MVAINVEEKLGELEITHDSATKDTQNDDAGIGKGGENASDNENGVQWESLLQLISQRVDEAIEAGKEAQEARTTEEHDRYYRAVFDKLLDEVASRNDIPNAVMRTPLRALTLTFCHSSLAGQCPCCLDYLDLTTATVNAGDDDPDGITKGHMIKALRDNLHPEPSTTGDDAPDSGRPKITLLNFCWMNDPSGGLVDNALFVYFGRSDDDSSSTRSVPGDGHEDPKASQDDDEEISEEE